MGIPLGPLLNLLESGKKKKINVMNKVVISTKAKTDNYHITKTFYPENLRVQVFRTTNFFK